MIKEACFPWKAITFSALVSRKQSFGFLNFFLTYIPKYIVHRVLVLCKSNIYLVGSCLLLHLCSCFRELCTKLYSMSWGNTQSWQEFDRFCEYNPVEVSMLTCLADVREPCQLGCRNLTYCTNFNNRQDKLLYMEQKYFITNYK